MIDSPFFCFFHYDKHYAMVRLAAFLRHILYTRMYEIHQTCKKSNGYYIRIYKEWYYITVALILQQVKLILQQKCATS